MGVAKGWTWLSNWNTVTVVRSSFFFFFQKAKQAMCVLFFFFFFFSVGPPLSSTKHAQDWETTRKWEEERASNGVRRINQLCHLQLCFLWQVTLPCSVLVFSFANADDDTCPAHLPHLSCEIFWGSNVLMMEECFVSHWLLRQPIY